MSPRHHNDAARNRKGHQPNRAARGILGQSPAAAFQTSDVLDTAVAARAELLAMPEASKLLGRCAVAGSTVERTYTPSSERWSSMVRITFTNSDHSRQATFLVAPDSREISLVKE